MIQITYLNFKFRKNSDHLSSELMMVVSLILMVNNF